MSLPRVAAVVDVAFGGIAVAVAVAIAVIGTATVAVAVDADVAAFVGCCDAGAAASSSNELTQPS